MIFQLPWPVLSQVRNRAMGVTFEIHVAIRVVVAMETSKIKVYMTPPSPLPLPITNFIEQHCANQIRLMKCTCMSAYTLWYTNLYT